MRATPSWPFSLALLGTGAGALWVYFVRPLTPEELKRRQVLLLTAFSIAIVVSLWFLLQIEFVPQKIENPFTQTVQDNLSFVERSAIMHRNPELFKFWKLFAAIPVAFFPFFLAGYLQAVIFRTDPAKFAQMYGIDLIGATFGSISIPLLLYPLGLKGTIFVIAALAVLPVIHIFLTGERKGWIAAACLMPLLAMGGLWASGSFQVRYAAGFADKDLIREHWSPMSRVALMHYRGQEMYVIDNGSRSFYAPGDEDTVRRYMRSLYTIPFQMKQGGDLLVIASGGGQEITMGSHFGMKRIDAVEIARPMVTDILRNKKDDPGNPYLLPNVNTYIADGRSVIMRSEHRYDIIEMLDVNFATVAGQISLAWSPNFISTQEAFTEFMEHLKDDGLLCFTIFSHNRTEKVRRLVSIIAGMKAAGIRRPENHLAIIIHGYRSMYMVKKTPYTREELVEISKITASRNEKFTIIYPDMKNIIGSDSRMPQQETADQTDDYVRGLTSLCRYTQPVQGLMATLWLPNQRGIPLTDDRPYLAGSGFFSETSRYDAMIGGLYRPLLAGMGVLGLVFVILPFIVRRPGGGEAVRIDLRLLLILAFTGIGFMFIEMAGIYKFQLYLHHPTIAMIVVLSSMILGAGLGSLHSGTMAESKKETRIRLYAGGAVVGCIILFLLIPLWAHRFLLWLPMAGLLPLVFLAFTALGFLLGHVVPLAIDSYGGRQSGLMAWCWAITVTGSVLGTVLASLLARDFGMTLVAVLGILSYLGVAAVSSAGVTAS